VIPHTSLQQKHDVLLLLWLLLWLLLLLLLLLVGRMDGLVEERVRIMC